MRRAAFALALGALASAGCSDEVHVFGAHHYDVLGDCLEGAAAVEVLEGPDPGPCEELRCWRSPEGQIFVTSTACDGPPGYEDQTDASDGDLCALALEAYARGEEGRCSADS